MSSRRRQCEVRWLVATSESLACFAASRFDTQWAVRGKVCLQSAAAVAGLLFAMQQGRLGGLPPA